ncbi:MAG TPA: hypothetical protein VFP16_05035 [Vicinamibacterales bacterium]|nr:hypothetical protein [Vicinamibacterales bacterium]
MSLSRIAIAIVTSASLAVSACTAPAEAPGNTPAANTPAAESEVPSEPGRQLSALAPENIAKARPAAPFDLTGNWFIDVTENPNAWRFGPPYPKLTAAAQVHFDASQVAAKEGKVYRDDIGQCWPAGLPLIMTRYWPMAMVQIPTAIYMVSGFMNSLRIVYLDGRSHTDPDIIVRTFNGESIGRWEGDTLVVDTVGFRGDHHWMDQGGASIPAGEQLHIVERIRLINGRKQLEIEYTMTDPEYWEGEWKSTKRFNRVNDEDIQEVSCLPDLNEHLQSTSSKTQVR